MTDSDTDPTGDVGQPKFQTDVINRSGAQGQTLRGQSPSGKAKLSNISGITSLILDFMRPSDLGLGSLEYTLLDAPLLQENSHPEPPQHFGSPHPNSSWRSSPSFHWGQAPDPSSSPEASFLQFRVFFPTHLGLGSAQMWSGKG